MLSPRWLPGDGLVGDERLGETATRQDAESLLVGRAGGVMGRAPAAIGIVKDTSTGPRARDRERVTPCAVISSRSRCSLPWCEE